MIYPLTLTVKFDYIDTAIEAFDSAWEVEMILEMVMPGLWRSYEFCQVPHSRIKELIDATFADAGIPQEEYCIKSELLTDDKKDEEEEL